MNYQIVIGVSYQDEYYAPGDNSTLDGWPAEAVAQLLRDGAIVAAPLPDVEPASDPAPDVASDPVPDAPSKRKAKAPAPNEESLA